MTFPDGVTLDATAVDMLQDHTADVEYRCIHLLWAKEVVFKAGQLWCKACATKSEVWKLPNGTCDLCEDVIQVGMFGMPFEYTPTPALPRCREFFFIAHICDFCLLQYATHN